MFYDMNKWIWCCKVLSLGTHVCFNNSTVFTKWEVFLTEEGRILYMGVIQYMRGIFFTEVGPTIYTRVYI